MNNPERELTLEEEEAVRFFPPEQTGKGRIRMTTHKPLTDADLDRMMAVLRDDYGQGYDYNNLTRDDAERIIAEVRRLRAALSSLNRTLEVLSVANRKMVETIVAAISVTALDAAPGEQRICVDCGIDDGSLVHYPTGLAGTGPLLSLCESCRLQRRRNNYAAPDQTGEV